MTILKNQPLSERCYYGLGGVASFFALPKNFSEVQTAVLWGQQQQLPIAVLGAGSNLLFADDKFNGLVISTKNLNGWCWLSSELLYVEAGVSNTEIAEICLAAGRTGASWMYRMPGLLGGTVRMNARCYGGEISQITKEVVTLDSCGTLKILSADKVFLGYKNTIFMQFPEIVLAAVLNLSKSATHQTILEHMDFCEQDRIKKHHFDYPSCGSTFKNNYALGKPTGQIMDELGMKGKTSGGAQISEYHGNFIWKKYSYCRSADVLDLAGQMKTEVKSKLQGSIELEVQPVGSFSENIVKTCGLKELGMLFPNDLEYWSGLFWHADMLKHQNPTDSTTQFPMSILKSRFRPYCQNTSTELTSFISNTTLVNIQQICSLSEAKNHPEQPFLRFFTEIPEPFKNKVFPLQTPAPENAFVDELWHYSVSEIFFANPENPECYLEFEVTPQGHWIAIEFVGKRQRHPKNQKPAAELWKNDVKPFKNNAGFGLEFSLRVLSAFIKNQTILCQSAISTGQKEYFLAPPWTQGKNETADFHQPDRFWPLVLKDKFHDF